MRTSTVYNLVDRVHNITKQRNKVITCDACCHLTDPVLPLGYLAPGSRRAQQSSAYKYAPVKQVYVQSQRHAYNRSAL